MELIDCLQELCNASGCGGLPEAAQKAETFLRPYVNETRIDTMGNVLGIRRCGVDNAPLVMLEAHIDEVGFMVTGVDDQGFVHVSSYGNPDQRVLAAQEVVIWGDQPATGVFCSAPPHLSGGDQDQLPDIAHIGVDTGLDSKRAKKRFPVGTRVTFRPNFHKINQTKVTSKGLDDRAGVAAVLRCLELVQGEALPCDVAAVFAVQEELGCRGSQTAAYEIDPDYAIAVDVSFAWTPDAERSKCGMLGDGPMIGWAPGLDTAMTRTLDTLAAQAEIPRQQEVMGGDTSTDADSIASSRAGVRTALLSVPLRYMHTPVELVDLCDVENTARLMAEFLRKGCAAL